MNCDYFIEINDKLKPLAVAIGSLDNEIKDKKEQIKNLTKGKKPKIEIQKLKEQQKLLENGRKQKWIEAYNIAPYFWSYWKALSSLYLQENDSSIAKLARDRYIKLQSDEGKERITQDIENEKLLNLFNFFKIPTVDISLLSPYSFFLQFTFTLATPYLSKDDEEFYIINNPVRKDKVFKVPMVAGSSWKGNMRWTARQINNNDNVIERLFGNDKDEKKDFHRGRLNFFPTFFDQIGLEVINPHDRKTKAGTLPIYIESVPAGATGTFTLLYVPFDLMGKPLDRAKKEVVEDIGFIGNVIGDMMLKYGFSAKKSSGFGIIKNKKEDGCPAGIAKIKDGKPDGEKFSCLEEMIIKIEGMLKTVEVRT